MAQTSGFDPTTQVKTCFDCKMFDVSNWVASLNGENGPGGTPSHEALSVSSQGALEISSVAGQPPWTEAIVAHLDWWQNPTNVMKGADLHPKDHSIQLFTDASNEGWGAHLDQNSTKGLWSEREKRLHINVLELKAVSLALRDFKDQCQNQTVLVATDNSTVVAYINKQGGNSLSRDVRSPVENHDLVPSLPYNIESQAHSRVSECDGRPPIQIQPSAVNRMVSAPSGLQANLPEVVHPSCRLIRHSPESQTPSICVSYPGPKGLEHRCSEHKTGPTSRPTPTLLRLSFTR